MRSTLEGCLRHFLLAILLNFKNPAAIVYGYLIPVIFLLAFGAVFRTGSPPLLAQMGQLVTITILGGACFGLPTALVAERERGVWRRYRLLPVATPWLILSAMLARLSIVASSVLFQLVAAGLIFGTPAPAHSGAFALGLLAVAAAFLGLGFLIAALADNVPAVQALGQCIFLPMIMIGGVGVPLAVLPVWAQRMAGFMPGRYAVELLAACFDPSATWSGARFRVAALLVIGLAAGVAGARLFRWETGRLEASARWWIAGALASWMAVGAIAWGTGHLKPVLPEMDAWSNITEAQIAGITFDGLPADSDIVTTLAPPDAPGVRAFAGKLQSWPPGATDDAGQSIRNLVAVAAIADLCADPREGEMARAVYDRIRSTFDAAAVLQALAWIVSSPDDGQTPVKAPELGLFRHPPERLVRQRSVLYAKKYLGRLLGKIRD